MATTLTSKSQLNPLVVWDFGLSSRAVFVPAACSTLGYFRRTLDIALT